MRLALLLLAACASRAPGYIDSHVHLAYYPVGAELRAHGVAAAVDLGGPLASLAEPAPLPLVRSGPILTAPGGYPLDSWGKDGYGLGCGTASEAIAAVDRLHGAGARVIKVAVFGARGLDDATLAAAVARAHTLHLKVAAHALKIDDVRRAAQAGVDVLAHTPTEKLPDDVVALWRGRAVISTLAAFGGKPDTVDNLRRLRAAGALVLYGTDLGNTRAAGINDDEVRLLHDAGLDDAAVRAAATTAPARYWGL